MRSLGELRAIVWHWCTGTLSTRWSTHLHEKRILFALFAWLSFEKTLGEPCWLHLCIYFHSGGPDACPLCHFIDIFLYSYFAILFYSFFYTLI